MNFQIVEIKEKREHVFPITDAVPTKRAVETPHKTAIDEARQGIRFGLTDATAPSASFRSEISVSHTDMYLKASFSREPGSSRLQTLALHGAPGLRDP